MIASAFLAFFNNLTFLFGTCYPGNTTDDMFVSSIFDSIKVVKTHSLTLGMQNLFVLIVFIFVMHDYLSRDPESGSTHWCGCTGGRNGLSAGWQGWLLYAQSIWGFI